LEVPSGGDAILIGEHEKWPIDLISTDMVIPKMSEVSYKQLLRNLKEVNDGGKGHRRK
jgi:hypothetical protein